MTKKNNKTKAPEIATAPLLTLADVAERLQCSLKTVNRRIETGDLPVIRDRRMVRIHPMDLLRYIKQRREV